MNIILALATVAAAVAIICRYRPRTKDSRDMLILLLVFAFGMLFASNSFGSIVSWISAAVNIAVSVFCVLAFRWQARTEAEARARARAKARALRIRRAQETGDFSPAERARRVSLSLSFENSAA